MSNQEVPIQFRCPICGKWGRRHIDPVTKQKYYHCNPRARKGGKGCGEYFRKLNPACEKIKSSLIEIELTKKGKTQRIIDMGFKMVKLLKEKGIHNPFRRTFPSSRIHTLFMSDSHCDCGCGRVTQGRRFASNTCADVTYFAAHMLGNQGERLYRFLVDLRGAKCEKCGDENGPFDVDHITEVNEGGGMCWIDNFQLLCRDKCHKEKTAQYAKRRAEERKKEDEDAIQPSPQLSFFN